MKLFIQLVVPLSVVVACGGESARDDDPSTTNAEDGESLASDCASNVVLAVPSCDPSTCEAGCFEVIPGQSVCLPPPAVDTECSQGADSYVCNCDSDEDCEGDQVCRWNPRTRVSDPPTGTSCFAGPACASSADCQPGDVCVPPTIDQVSFECATPECTSDADCPAHYLCALAYYPIMIQFSPMLLGVRCILDPTECEGV